MPIAKVKAISCCVLVVIPNRQSAVRNWPERRQLRRPDLCNDELFALFCVFGNIPVMSVLFVLFCVFTLLLCNV